MRADKNQNEAERIANETTDTPLTSAKESNENDLQMKSDKEAFRSEQEATVASEALRYDEADRIYPDLE